MLGRKDYTREELTAGRARIDAQLAAYRALPETGDYEPVFTSGLVLVLDRLYVHRVRPVSGKDTNPLTEVELLAASFLTGDVFVDQKAIKWVPEKSVTGVRPGERVALDLPTTQALVDAFFAELEKRFVG
ncbi:hypothetical protein [Pseudonocardia pini]|uniref:hypothetical protein n=1 Tax=Pseudonocardia pini TaxID=2758030 RepID=UPI0015F0E8D6|nr:hypothetical protein [Pseudonocardia pini]